MFPKGAWLFSSAFPYPVDARVLHRTGFPMTDASSIAEINRVLHEERESRARIEACRQKADEIIENGRHQARRISNRADERIGIVQARTDLCIDARLAEVRQQIAALSDDAVATDRADPQLRAAIEALTNELVGEVE